MSKLTKKDKLNIYKEWTIENKRSTYLSKKYGIGSVSIKYLVSLIHRHGMDILDKPYTYYSAQFKLEAINRVLVNHETAYSVSLELGLKSQGILINWIRSYKENGYNVVIKRKGRRTCEQRAREIEERKRRIASPEFKAYCRECIYKKIGCLGSKEKKPTKTEIAQAVRELRLELRLGVKTILSTLNDPNNALPSLSRSNYYDILKREDQDEIKHHSLIKRIKEIFFELKDRYTAPGYRTITDHLHSEGFIINRKTVYRLMRKLNLIGYRMKRNFFVIRPNMKWYTDITEFNLIGQKLYLSPIIDGCGRDIVAYNISRSPNLQQVMTMLDDAFKANDSLNGLVFHSDRGWQYQHKTYQYELARRGIEQSMSRKGYSPDDGLMEGFFGILKREMFYGKEDLYANLNELEQAIRDYIHFYNYERTKTKLKGLTPIQYRNQSLSA